MGSIRVAGIRFTAHPQDHMPRHVHAMTGSGEVIIELLTRGKVRLDQRTQPVRGATTNDVRKALKVAAFSHDLLIQLWEKAR